MKRWTFGRSVLLTGLVIGLGLLAGWGGRAWADPVVGTAKTITGTSELNGVACPTATLCLGVGNNSSNVGVVVPLTSIGGTVEAGTIKTVTGTSVLNGVACPTAVFCIAAGESGTGEIVPVPVSGNTVSLGIAQSVAGTIVLNGVACPTATLCVAVGFNNLGEGVVAPLTVSGSTVDVGTAQTATGTAQLFGIACPTATLCVGVANDSTGAGAVVLVTISGGTVSTVTAQSVAGTFPLSGVGCLTAALCIGAGASSGGPAVIVPVTVSGSTVAAGTVQTVSGVGELDGVTCPAAGLCLAVGVDGGYPAPIVPLTFSGSTIIAGTTQTITIAALLRGVACSAAGLCLGVGSTSFGAGTGVVVPIVPSVPTGSTTQLTASQNPSLAGQPVTFTAVVNCALSPDGGTVEFEDASINPPAVIGSAPVSGDVAVLKTAGLSVGAHTIVAVYEGNANCNGSTSNALQRQVLAPAGTITLTSSRNPSSLNQAVTFTATASCFTAGETITFLDGQTVLGTRALNAHGVAKLTTSSLSGGRYSITASYPGDANCLAGDSAPLTQTVFGFGG